MGWRLLRSPKLLLPLVWSMVTLTPAIYHLYGKWLCRPQPITIHNVNPTISQQALVEASEGVSNRALNVPKRCPSYSSAGLVHCIRFQHRNSEARAQQCMVSTWSWPSKRQAKRYQTCTALESRYQARAAISFVLNASPSILVVGKDAHLHHPKRCCSRSRLHRPWSKYHPNPRRWHLTHQR